MWVRMSDQFVSHVAVGQHKGYQIKVNHEVVWTSQGDGRPGVVYHKDGGVTMSSASPSERTWPSPRTTGAG